MFYQDLANEPVESVNMIYDFMEVEPSTQLIEWAKTNAQRNLGKDIEFDNKQGGRSPTWGTSSFGTTRDNPGKTSTGKDR